MITRTTKSPAGTYLKGYVALSYSALLAAFGEPTSDGYKVSSGWVLEFKGRVFTIYDYKDTALYDSELQSVESFRALPSFEWHIGSDGDVGEFAEALREQVSK